MPKRIKNKPLSKWKSHRPDARAGALRIIGGSLRGRPIEYSGDPRTRPMKDNIREAVFNLVGGYLSEKHAFDLFAGTGAIGLEAISRGASHATMIERHIPSANLIQTNADQLGVADRITLITSDTCFWFRQFASKREQHPTEPWIVFCSPPYAMFLERESDLMNILETAIELAPPDSVFVCESDSKFRLRALPDYPSWRTRHYSPAVVSIYQKIDE